MHHGRIQLQSEAQNTLLFNDQMNKKNWTGNIIRRSEATIVIFKCIVFYSSVLKERCFLGFAASAAKMTWTALDKTPTKEHGTLCCPTKWSKDSPKYWVKSSGRLQQE